MFFRPLSRPSIPVSFCECKCILSVLLLDEQLCGVTASPAHHFNETAVPPHCWHMQPAGTSGISGPQKQGAQHREQHVSQNTRKMPSLAVELSKL